MKVKQLSQLRFSLLPELLLPMAQDRKILGFLFFKSACRG